ncbi:receptor-like protein 20 [Quercus suber]|uniref:Receptor-like protein 20 n=1 Tax=Quercus suber TaxID=58331 RepID=A0AAW0J497_QUESU
MNSTFNSSIPKLQLLILVDCNLTEFPFFLRYQHEMEYLDLQNNKIQGQIPKWIFNMGKETLFDSYLGNTGLCGSPLTKKCKISETSTKPPPISKQGEFSKFPNKLDWVVIMMGYGSGLIIGFVIGHNLTIRKLERFVRV